ncbi:hypothetical protein [Streptomyces sp. MK37H]|uniref:hypothetical protein n=1 Tax=Streptomyces sp. MK37H TaxID=2699117 RepID=UPI001B38B669|nr:hypothetical protein [Streptomyces sp. MK37H]MBP8531932.1 hypothetical protein [Streptomyces sp. MK37H]
MSALAIPAQRLDRLRTMDLNDVPLPRRGLRRHRRTAADQQRRTTGRQTAPVLGVAANRQPVPYETAGVGRGDQPVPQRRRTDDQRRSGQWKV